MDVVNETGVSRIGAERFLFGRWVSGDGEVVIPPLLVWFSFVRVWILFAGYISEEDDYIVKRGVLH